MHKVSFTSAEGRSFTFQFQTYWDATIFAMNVEKNGGTNIAIEEDPSKWARITGGDFLSPSPSP